MNYLLYAYNKQHISPACASVPQGWKKGTQKEVNSSKVKNLSFNWTKILASIKH
jgi:uncharacterized protein YbdZ (MbtH family)